ncbi:hypothetical protein AA313_de0201375 [Arthrobotrys entomopaga]|nr:hypothetical protein AA313_de0201375 [Arthrobotrys entomopaga]
MHAGISVDRPAMKETTALGAAIAAGLSVNIWSSLDDLQHVNSRDHQKFTAKTTSEQQAKQFRRWERAVEMSKGWLTTEDIDQTYD